MEITYETDKVRTVWIEQIEQGRVVLTARFIAVPAYGFQRCHQSKSRDYRRVFRNSRDVFRLNPCLRKAEAPGQKLLRTNPKQSFGFLGPRKKYV
jgi:hypothetical protein